MIFIDWLCLEKRSYFCMPHWAVRCRSVGITNEIRSPEWQRGWTKLWESMFIFIHLTIKSALQIILRRGAHFFWSPSRCHWCEVTRPQGVWKRWHMYKQNYQEGNRLSTFCSVHVITLCMLFIGERQKNPQKETLENAGDSPLAWHM